MIVTYFFHLSLLLMIITYRLSLVAHHLLLASHAMHVTLPVGRGNVDLAASY